MNVLVACEFSGVVRDAFIARGHNAWSCDLLPSESPIKGPHYTCDVYEVLMRFGRYQDNEWDLMIAHPPCTYLTNAGVRHLHENVTSKNGVRAKVYGAARMLEMHKAADFFLFLANAHVPRICVENPIPHKYAREIIGPYTQLIQPWQFGHGETKGTGLWLRNLPTLQPTHRKNDLFALPEPTGRVPRVHMTPPGPDRWKKRSVTYRGIAAAMAEQWGS
jgi:hypothetical protein